MTATFEQHAPIRVVGGLYTGHIGFIEHPIPIPSDAATATTFLVRLDDLKLYALDREDLALNTDVSLRSAETSGL